MDVADVLVPSLLILPSLPLLLPLLPLLLLAATPLLTDFYWAAAQGRALDEATLGPVKWSRSMFPRGCDPVFARLGHMFWAITRKQVVRMGLRHRPPSVLSNDRVNGSSRV